MSRAEKFIQAHTKALKESNGKEYFMWLTPDDARKAVEIVREEIYEWLKEYADTYTWYNELVGESGMTDDFIDDLKQAMKDETQNL